MRFWFWTLGEAVLRGLGFGRNSIAIARQREREKEIKTEIKNERSRHHKGTLSQFVRS